MSISSSDVADFFKENPDFLLHNPGVLAFVNLPSQLNGNVSSLQEKQLQTMRNKVKALEHELVSLTRNAVENQTIIDNLFALQKQLLMTRQSVNLPKVLVEQISGLFNVPMICLKLWISNPVDKLAEFESGLSLQAQKDLSALDSTYCGFYEKSPVTGLFDQEEVKPRSIVLIPLRDQEGKTTFGCLALGSDDKDRFTPNLGKEFLYSLTEIACASLVRLTQQN